MMPAVETAKISSLAIEPVVAVETHASQKKMGCCAFIKTPLRKLTCLFKNNQELPEVDQKVLGSNSQSDIKSLCASSTKNTHWVTSLLCCRKRASASTVETSKTGCEEEVPISSVIKHLEEDADKAVTEVSAKHPADEVVPVDPLDPIKIDSAEKETHPSSSLKETEASFFLKIWWSKLVSFVKSKLKRFQDANTFNNADRSILKTFFSKIAQRIKSLICCYKNPSVDLLEVEESVSKVGESAEILSDDLIDSFFRTVNRFEGMSSKFTRDMPEEKDKSGVGSLYYLNSMILDITAKNVDLLSAYQDQITELRKASTPHVNNAEGYTELIIRSLGSMVVCYCKKTSSNLYKGFFDFKNENIESLLLQHEYKLFMDSLFSSKTIENQVSLEFFVQKNAIDFLESDTDALGRGTKPDLGFWGAFKKRMIPKSKSRREASSNSTGADSFLDKGKKTVSVKSAPGQTSSSSAAEFGSGMERQAQDPISPKKERWPSLVMKKLGLSFGKDCPVLKEDNPEPVGVSKSISSSGQQSTSSNAHATGRTAGSSFFQGTSKASMERDAADIEKIIAELPAIESTTSTRKIILSSQCHKSELGEAFVENLVSSFVDKIKALKLREGANFSERVSDNLQKIDFFLELVDSTQKSFHEFNCFRKTEQIFYSAALFSDISEVLDYAMSYLPKEQNQVLEQDKRNFLCGSPENISFFRALMSSLDSLALNFENVEVAVEGLEAITSKKLILFNKNLYSFINKIFSCLQSYYLDSSIGTAPVQSRAEGINNLKESLAQKSEDNLPINLLFKRMLEARNYLRVVLETQSQYCEGYILGVTQFSELPSSISLQFSEAYKKVDTFIRKSLEENSNCISDALIKRFNENYKNLPEGDSKKSIKIINKNIATWTEIFQEAKAFVKEKETEKYCNDFYKKFHRFLKKQVQSPKRTASILRDRVLKEITYIEEVIRALGQDIPMDVDEYLKKLSGFKKNVNQSSKKRNLRGEIEFFETTMDEICRAHSAFLQEPQRKETIERYNQKKSNILKKLKTLEKACASGYHENHVELIARKMIVSLGEMNIDMSKLVYAQMQEFVKKNLLTGVPLISTSFHENKGITVSFEFEDKIFLNPYILYAEISSDTSSDNQLDAMSFDQLRQAIQQRIAKLLCYQILCKELFDSIQAQNFEGMDH